MVSPSRSNGSIDDFFLATRCSQRQQHLSQNTRVSGIAEIEVSGQPRPRPPPDHSKCETCRGRINRLKSTARHEQWQLRPSRHWRIFAPKSAWSRAVRSFISEALGALLKVRIDHSDSHPGPPFMPLLKSCSCGFAEIGRGVPITLKRLDRRLFSRHSLFSAAAASLTEYKS